MVDNSAVNYYANRKKTGKLYDTSSAAFTSEYIPKEMAVNAIKREKPAAIIIADKRLGWLESEDFFNEMYEFDREMYGNRIYLEKN